MNDVEVITYAKMTLVIRDLLAVKSVDALQRFAELKVDLIPYIDCNLVRESEPGPIRNTVYNQDELIASKLVRLTQDILHRRLDSSTAKLLESLEQMLSVNSSNTQR